jgi:hypothetical protein
MKKITLLFAFLITSIGFSQTYDLLSNGDFENGKGSWGGSDFTVVGGEAYFATSNAAGDPWGTQLTYGGLTFENAKEYVLTFKARSTEDRKITVAIQNSNAGWSDQFRQDFDITATMTEYTVTFNATSDNAGGVQIGFLMGNFGTTTGVYYDDITLITAGTVAETCSDNIMNNGETGVDCGGPNCDACPAPPTTAPTAPMARNAGDVVSIYGDTYTQDAQVAAGNFDAGWCGANSVTEVNIAGNNVIQYNGNDCQGIVLANGIDVTSYTMMHVDVYIDASVDVTSKVFNLKFVQQPGGAAKEYNFNAGSTPALVAGEWFSIDVAIDLAGMTSFKEFGITANNLKNQVWYDNLYIYRDATASVDNNTLLGFSMYPNPASNKLNISAKETIQNADIFNVIGKKVMSVEINETSKSIDISSLTSGIYLVKYNVNGTTGTAKFIKQ